MINYIQGTIGLPLLFSINKSGNINWYIDASFIVHKDFSSHTGGFMAMVIRGAYVQSRKQKLNTKSSTGDKLVVVEDVLIEIICTQ